MSQAGFFDFEDRLEPLNNHGNPLRTLEAAIDFEAFGPTLSKVRKKPRKSNAGRKPLDVVMMFKMLVLGSLYGLSDEQLEYQVRDRPGKWFDVRSRRFISSGGSGGARREDRVAVP